MLKQPRTSMMTDRFRTIGELLRMLQTNGRWWAVPLFAVIVCLSLVLVALQAIPYVAPFIYSVI